MRPAAARTAVTPRTPTVSVVMAAYNAQRFLADAIESVLAQTFADFELLVVDDASTDDTPSIIERYARRDRRIRALRLPRNVGTAQAKNAALEQARSPFVAVCDDDDRQWLERLASQVTFLEANPEHVMVGCRVRPFGDVAGAPLAWLPAEDARARAHVLFQALYVDSANLFRRDLASVHGLRYPAGMLWDDWAFQAMALRLGEVHVLPQTLLDYRRHAGQQTSPARLTTSGPRTRATLQRVFQIAGIACSEAELHLHHAISPSPFGVIPDRAYLLRHAGSFDAEARDWIARLGGRAVRSGWTTAEAFAHVADEIRRRLPRLRGAAWPGAQVRDGGWATP